MKRKIFAIALVLSLLFGLSGCSLLDKLEDSSQKLKKAADIVSGSEQASESKTKSKAPSEAEDDAPSKKTKVAAEPTPRPVNSPEEVYAIISPSVVEIVTYDADGYALSIGSGFFLEEDGTVVTNYHVIEGAYSADIMLSDSGIYAVNGVYAWDADLDLAILSTKKTSAPAAVLSADGVVTGETVYALGSSEGLTGTFSDGIVSTASRVIDGVDCIQTTAPISHGNSGGPLVNSYGEVVGVNSMTLADGQNLNFAINISELDRLERSDRITMEEFYDVTDGASYTYDSGTDHEGEEIYDEADSIEAEPNDVPQLADALENGEWMAGYLDAGDFDYFSIEAEEECDMDIYILPYYIDDLDYLLPIIMNEEYDILTDENGDAYLPEQENYDETYYNFLSLHLDEAGTYYITLLLPDDYEYDVGAYYLLSVDWY